LFTVWPPTRKEVTVPASLVLPVGGVCCSQFGHPHTPLTLVPTDRGTAPLHRTKRIKSAAWQRSLVCWLVGHWVRCTTSTCRCTNRHAPTAACRGLMRPSRCPPTSTLPVSCATEASGSAVRRDAWTKLSPISRRRTVPLISPPFSWLAACRTHTCGARVLV
jgi:hypothetical protein